MRCAFVCLGSLKTCNLIRNVLNGIVGLVYFNEGFCYC